MHINRCGWSILICGHLMLVIICVVIGYCLVGRSDSEAERMQEDEHCAMVKLWKETGGEAGWPAFYSDKVCE